MRKVHLVIIDPQNSFCQRVPADQQDSRRSGELFVDGADEDMSRLAKMVDRLGSKLSDIHVTLDSHQQLHIAHGVWWKNCSNGDRPSPFTTMSARNGKIFGKDLSGQETEFITSLPSLFARSYKYLENLEASGRYSCTIWPEHCRISTEGFCVVPELMDSLLRWSKQNFATINFVTKGSNPFTEHYSALRAEVPDSNDPGTQINTDFLQMVYQADEILLSGEALSHCLKSTVEDMANEFADDSFIKKCTLLTDATSPVTYFEKQAQDFINNMQTRGMKLSTTVDYLR